MAKAETVISRAALFALPEYSCTIPTGTTVGKRWRINNNAYRADRVGVPAEWMLGEYYDLGDPKAVGVRFSWAVSEPGVVHRGDKEDDHVV